MADREKVMTWLEICGKNLDCSGTCPYTENGFGEYGQCRETLMADALELLKEQPDIVRCKDCIHYRYYGLTDDAVSECTIDHCENPDTDWFCADGERRTDDA